MGKITIRVDSRTGQNYLPRDIRRDGFVGEIEGLANALTVTFIKPGANLSDVEKSLHIILDDIALRRQQEGSIQPREKNTEERKESQGKLPTRQAEVPQAGPHPIFIKYTRAWLHEATGYSRGYLCRVATGKIPLSRSFMAKAVLALGESGGSLFLLEGAEGENKNQKEGRKWTDSIAE